MLRHPRDEFTKELSCFVEMETACQFEIVIELVECMVYCCTTRESRKRTVASKLLAVNFFHEQLRRAWKGCTPTGVPSKSEDAAVVEDAASNGRGGH